MSRELPAFIRPRTAALWVCLSLATIACERGAPEENAEEGEEQRAMEDGAVEQSASQQPSATLEEGQEQESAPPLSRDEAMETRIETLRENMNGTRFNRDDMNVENADLFLYVAGSRQHDDELVVPALQALQSTWSARATDSRRAVDEQYGAVLLYHLGASEGPTLSEVIDASGSCLQREDSFQQSVFDRLVEIAESHENPAARMEAIDEFGSSYGIRQNPEAFNVLIANLDADEAWLVSETLKALGSASNARALPEPEAVFERLLALADHDDPGVRGRAATTMGRLAAANETLQEQAVAKLYDMMDDENPFTRSEAFDGLAILRHEPAIHRLIEHADDMTRNTYDIRDWQRLNGTSGRLHHDGSAWSRVGDAALSAIETLTRRTDYELERDRVDVHNAEASLQEQAQAARSWYEANAASIPRD